MDTNVLGTGITIANAVEFVSEVMLDLAKEELCCTIDGKDITKELIADTILSQIMTGAEKNYVK